MLRAARRLADLYRSNKDFKRSIPLAEDVLKRSRESRGPNQLDTLEAMHILASSYLAAGRLPQATDVLEQAWARAKERPDPPAGILEIPTTLAGAYSRSGHPEKAESVYRDALEAARRAHVEASSEAAYVQILLAGSLLERQEYAEAERLLRECLKFREEHEPDLWQTFNAKSALGGCLLGQKKYDEAEPLLLAGYEGLKRREDKNPRSVPQSRLSEAIGRLVQLYGAKGDAARADEWRRKPPAKKPAESAARPIPNQLPDDVFARP
jgi:tetratricopeptide (TPR) repeat protein